MMEWRECYGNPTYEISEFGEVRRTIDGHACKKGKILKGSIGTGGYRYFKLMHPDGKYREAGHRLVIEAFVGPCPDDKTEVAHNDGVPDNNHYSNLRWATVKENQNDRKLHGTTNDGSKNGRAKMTEFQVIGARNRFDRLNRKRGAITLLANEYGLSHSSMWEILKGNRKWKHVG